MTARTTSSVERVRSLLVQKETVLIGLILVTTVVAVVTLPAFRTQSSFIELGNGASIVMVVAVGQAVVIIARHIDISVGATLGISAFLAGNLVQHVAQFGLLVAIAVAMAAGAALGLVNGFLVATLKMPSLIATLATLSIFAGLQRVITNEQQVYSFQLPTWVLNFSTTTWLGIGQLVWLTIFTAIVGTYLMKMTRWGRDIYAMGSNPDAAENIGIPVNRRTYQIFAFCGALAGLAGFMYLGRYGNVDATVGSNFLLPAIAAAVVGGVSLFGGSGTPFGAVLGGLLLTEIAQIISIFRISTFAQQTLQGVAIVVYVVLYSLLNLRANRRARARASTGGAETPTAPREEPSR